MVAVPLMVVAACARTAPPSDGGPDRPRFVTSFGPSTDQPIPDYRQAYDVAADAAKVWFRNDLGDADWRKALARAATDDFARRVRAAEVARPASGSLRPTVTGAVAPRRSSPERIEFVAQTDTAPLLFVTVRVDGAWRLADVRGAT